MFPDDLFKPLPIKLDPQDFPRYNPALDYI